VIADRTAYNVQYSYRQLSGIAIVSMSVYLLTVSNKCTIAAGSLFLMPVSF